MTESNKELLFTIEGYQYDDVKKYLNELENTNPQIQSLPLEFREPSSLIVSFIISLSAGGVIALAGFLYNLLKKPDTVIILERSDKDKITLTSKGIDLKKDVVMEIVHNFYEDGE